MNVYYDLDQLPSFKNAVLTIGSFDGIHRGHQKILERVNQLARDNKGESVVITFHPHPRLIVYPKDKTLHLLTSVEEKVALLERYGVDNVVIVPFTIEFSQQHPDEYIEKFLIGKFNPKNIVIGYDHRFGLNRQGDINYLKWAGKDSDFEVIEIPKQEVDDIAISSTKIRNFMLAGKVKDAAYLLNHNFTLIGKVVKGQQIGKTIGYPTANVEVESAHKLVPPYGIYAVLVHYNKKTYQAMLYIGDRPTVDKSTKRSIEVNIFDFNEDIYGKMLQIEFIDFVRDDEKFDSLEALKVRIAKDKEATLAILNPSGKMTANNEKKNPSKPVQ